MKGIRNIYRRLATLLCVALAGMNGVCWGQALVNVPIENVEISDGQNAEFAIDGETSGNYCSIEGNRTGTMTLTLANATDIDQVVVWLGNNRPSSITVSTSSNRYDDYDQAGILNRRISDGSNPIELTRYTTNVRYIRLTFEWTRWQDFVRIYEVEVQRERQNDEIRVVHKRGMWYDDDYQRDFPRRDGGNMPDTFDEDEEAGEEQGMISHNGILYQNTHVYEADIYVNVNSSVRLSLPSQINNDGDNNSLEYYQRWYDYNTDGKIETGSITPINQYGNAQNNRAVEYVNGLMGGSRLNNTPVWRVRYDVPSDFDSVTIACDASRYTDISWNSEGNLVEPTLSNRNIFRIKNAEEIKREIQEETQAGEYYEEYEIHFPARRISNKPEVVALRMAARNYFKPEDDGANAAVLDITSEGGVILSTHQLGGDNHINGVGDAADARVIEFTYNDKLDGERAYIYVKNGIYNVARFALVFDINTEGLTQTQVENIESNQSHALYKRTNAFMEANYINLSTMNFDYTTVTEGLQDRDYYPYPMDWAYSSYGFYANDDNQIKGDYGFPEWGEYAIMSSFNSLSGGGEPLQGSRYHLFVDASDKPGTIMKMEVEGERLCPSAMLYVTAWIKNQAWGGGHSEASLIFVLKGVDENGEEAVIFRHATGQIPKQSESSNIGDWHQIYFSYPNGDKVYSKYILQLDNNCTNSTGGDICLDDIRFYMNPLEVEGQTVVPVCSDDVLATIQLRLNYEQMLGRVGLENTNNSEKVEATIAYYCFLDKVIYDAMYDGSNYQEAFEAALVHGSGTYPGTGSTENYGVFTFYNNRESNDGEEGVASMDGDNVLTFTSHVGEGADPNVTTSYLHAGRGYYILYSPVLNENLPLWEQFNREDICTIQGEFAVEGRLIIRGDGTADIESSIPCIGEIPIISADMQDSEGNVMANVYFDWYFGTVDDFYKEEIENHPDRTLADALEAFRYFYPTAHEISNAIREEVGEARTDGVHVLYKEDLDLLATLNSDYSTEGGEQPKLALSASKNLNVHLMQEFTDVVVIPISIVTDESSELTCWIPQGIVLQARGNAPTLKAGFDGEEGYPENNFISVRLGLSHVDVLQSDNGYLDIPLRDATDGDGSPANLTTVPSDKYLYLGGTSDPEYTELVGDGLSYVIGNIKELIVNSSPVDNHIQIHLYKDDDSQGLNIKEGHSYTLNFRFQLAGTTSSGSCNMGNLTIPLLIVPEYQKWIGGTTGNWNNDGNWQRSTAEELKKNTSSYKASTIGSQGYAPLGFCKLTIPEGTDIQLYNATRPSGSRFLDLKTNKGDLSDATPMIEYDLTVAFNQERNAISCYSYYTNVCNQIHFEPDAEILHAELLRNYTKAHVDYRLNGSRWYTLASPLKGVVAGDFYTDSPMGTEEQEYFTDITFDANSNNNGNIPNNRFCPSVYQRGWKGSTDLITVGNGENEGDVTDVAIYGNWSSLYNDVTEVYEPGAGFSLKIEDLQGNDPAIFRLPKADRSYSYYIKGNLVAPDGSTVTISRGQNSGKLKSDDLAGSTTSFDVQLNETTDGSNYYLVGNPFMAHLDMKKFLTTNGNENVLEPKYWYADNGIQDIAVTNYETDETWTTAGNNTSIPPLRSFFVKKIEGAGNTITFTHEMQRLGDASTGESGTRALRITATNAEGKMSRAMVAADAMASDDYRSAEDVELFLDSNLGDVPMVYTVAGTMATSINARPTCERVPLGVYGARDEEVTLRFEGTDAFSGLTLYDARTGQATALRESTELRVATNDYGRYYLIGGVPTGTESIHPGNDIEIYSIRPGEIVVTTTGSPLRTVCVYGVNGALVARQSLTNQSVYRLAVSGNALYMIYAEDAEGIIRNVKMRVR